MKVFLVNWLLVVCVLILLFFNVFNVLRWEGFVSICGRVWDDVVFIEMVILMNFIYLFVKCYMELFFMVLF